MAREVLVHSTRNGHNLTDKPNQTEIWVAAMAPVAPERLRSRSPEAMFADIRKFSELDSPAWAGVSPALFDHSGGRANASPQILRDRVVTQKFGSPPACAPLTKVLGRDHVRRHQEVICALLRPNCRCVPRSLPPSGAGGHARSTGSDRGMDRK